MSRVTEGCADSATGPAGAPAAYVHGWPRRRRAVVGAPPPCDGTASVRHGAPVPRKHGRLGGEGPGALWRAPTGPLPSPPRRSPDSRHRRHGVQARRRSCPPSAPPAAERLRAVSFAEILFECALPAARRMSAPPPLPQLRPAAHHLHLTTQPQLSAHLSLPPRLGPRSLRSSTAATRHPPCLRSRPVQHTSTKSTTTVSWTASWPTPSAPTP